MANRMAIGEDLNVDVRHWRARYQQVELASKAITIPSQSTRAPRARYLLYARNGFSADVKGIATVLILTVDIFSASRLRRILPCVCNSLRSRRMVSY